MRGHKEDQSSMYCLVSPESFVPRDHPLRGIKALVEEALRGLSGVFDSMYARRGRDSVPPETLLKAKLLQALFSVRSDRAFCEQLHFNLLYRWFLDMDLMDKVFDHSTFSKNQERLLRHEVSQRFLSAVCQQAELAGLMSKDHFAVDGTLIEAWASLKSFKPKEDQTAPSHDDDDKGNPTVDFRGEKRSNGTHQSTTDPESKLMRKSNGTTAKLSFGGHALMENRHGLLVNVVVTTATGTSEREAGLAMLATVAGGHRITAAADKAYDTADFVAACRARNVTPHVAPNTGRAGGSAIDGRTTRHQGHAISQRYRKLIEEFFGWAKTIGGARKTRYKGVARTHFMFQMVAAAYNLLRMTKLMTKTA